VLLVQQLLLLRLQQPRLTLQLRRQTLRLLHVLLV
jgi:hypothetical protein